MSEQAQRREETEAERLDRNLLDLMQELRVAFPGVQIVFAFLLVVPFQSGWPDVTSAARAVYYVTLLLTAVSSVCFIAPTARHRIRFRDEDLDWVVTGSNRLMIAGLICLAAAISSALLLVTMVVFSTTFAIVVCALTLSTTAVIWFGIPLARNRKQGN